LNENEDISALILRKGPAVIVTAAKLSELGIDKPAYNFTWLFDMAEEESVHTMIFDMDGLEMISSAFIGFLLGVYQRLKKHSARLVLCRMTPSIVKALELTKVTRFFYLCGTLEEAEKRVQKDVKSP